MCQLKPTNDRAPSKYGINMTKILYISGSLGLGHVGRDLEIAAELRRIRPDVEISWMAESPASAVIEKAGEKLLPESSLIYKSNAVIEESAKDYKANLVQWTMNVRKGWAENGKIYNKVFESNQFDLCVGDETYDLIVALVNNPSLKKFPFVVIYDFLGLDALTWNPIEHIAAYLTNRLWVRFLRSAPPLADRSIYIGELEDVCNRGFGFMLPNRRELAKKVCNFVGYILPEDIYLPKYADKTSLRRELDPWYGDGPLITCSIGGTSAGKDLLDLCVAAYPLVKREKPTLQMVLVCGPRVPTESVKTPDGDVKVLGYVPKLYRHLAAADICIVSGGGTVTLELTALEKPFLYFPIEQHFEQQLGVSHVCQRHRAGIRMTLSKTSPESLAETILSNLEKTVDYAKIPINGAQESAKIINGLL
jgi:predicted glycosyltransferase